MLIGNLIAFSPLLLWTWKIEKKEKKKRSNTELFVHQQVGKFGAECVKNLLRRSMIP